MDRRSSMAPHIQMGLIESETHEIIELINSYTMPADFFQWLSGGSFDFKILQQEIEDGKFKRISQFHIGSSLVFTGRVEINTESFSKETIQFLANANTPFLSSSPALSRVRVDRVSKIMSETYYTTISNLLNLKEPAGVSWEIYELPQIIQIYKKLADPLRHWRNS